MTHGSFDTPPEANRPASILDLACGPAELTDSYLIEAIGRCAGSDWKAASWILERHPRFCRTWGSTAAIRREVRRALTTVVQVIEDSSVTPDQRIELLTRLVAAGIEPGALEPEEDG